MSESKFDALVDYKTSPLFNEAERAALAYVTELTRNKRIEPRHSIACESIIPSGRFARLFG